MNRAPYPIAVSRGANATTTSDWYITTRGLTVSNFGYYTNCKGTQFNFFITGV